MADSVKTRHIVLMFAYHFPPEAEIGAARPGRFYKYLKRMGYDCRIITAAEQGRHPPGDVTVVPDPFFNAPRKGLRWQIERAIRWTVLPGDVGFAWSCDAYRVARAIIDKERDARITIFSTFPPIGVHLAAWRLARKTKLPWIADFRDPLGYKQTHGISNFHIRFKHWVERRIIRATDAIIANTDACQAYWWDEHPNRKDQTYLVWNGFDPESRIKAKSLPPAGPRLLSHVGSLYAGRTAGPVLESIARLISRGSVSPHEIRLRLIGSIEPGTLGSDSLVETARSQGWLELVINAVPPAEALDIIQTSHYLLIIQQQSGVQVPAKLFEYLQIGRPILAFLTPDSCTERILSQSGVPFRCIYTGDSPQRMDKTIEDFLKLPTTVSPASSWFEEHFNGELQTRTVASIIDTVKPGRR